MTFKCTLCLGDMLFLSHVLVRKQEFRSQVKQLRLYWNGINSHKNLFSSALFNSAYFTQPCILTLQTWAGWSVSSHWCLNSVKYPNEGIQVQTLLGNGVFKTDCKSSLLKSVGNEQCLNVSQEKNEYIFH